jgi:signal transduction histidine kinase/PAS domain-containing protein
MSPKPTYEELAARLREYERAEPRRKQIETEHRMFLEVLHLINETDSLEELLGAILERLKHWSGCEAVAIRLKDGPDFPYFVTSGFPDRFVELERHLCQYGEDGQIERDADGNPQLECMCGNILRERFDPAKNFFTSDGSFWSNCTTRLLATTTSAERQARTRNHCNSVGYESVALIPLRSAGETFGLIQLNDHQEGRFSPESIATYRRIADYVASFLAKRQARAQREAAEESRKYQEQLLRDMGRLAKVGGWEFIPATGEGTWTEEVARIHDLDPDTETSMERGLSFYRGASRTKIENAVKAAIEFGAPYDLELQLVSAKGIHKWVRTIGRPKIEKGKVVQVRGSFQDITRSKLAEERISHLNRVLKAIRDINQLIVRERDPSVLIREGCRLLVDNRGYLSALIIRIDENERPHSWAGAGPAASAEVLNKLMEQDELPPCWERVRTEAEVLHIDDRLGVCSRCPLAEGCAEPHTHAMIVRLAHEETAYGYLIVGLDPSTSANDEERGLFAEMAGDLAFALHVLQSEAKRKSLESQLIQAQKMESIGRLAGGVAHDYNNMLSVILGFTQLAMEKMSPDDPLQEDLSEILNAANRSTDITRQLLAFARRQTIAPKVLNLNETVEGVLKMLRRLIGEDIDLAWGPKADLWPVKMDPSQIDQILANLCVNARDAITGVGKITIETGNTAFDEAYCIDHPGFVPGEYVMLAMSDDGIGMPPEVLGQIFEPFFTTKDAGKGTGLGLSTVYGVVKQNNGFINVYSEPAKGTTFRIYLPAHKGPTTEERIESTRQIPTSRGGETILLVEDDTSLLKLTSMMLDGLGYAILTASSPAEAIAMAREYPNRSIPI